MHLFQPNLWENVTVLRKGDFVWIRDLYENIQFLEQKVSKKLQIVWKRTNEIIQIYTNGPLICRKIKQLQISMTDMRKQSRKDRFSVSGQTTSSFPVGGFVTDVSEHSPLSFFLLSNASSYLSFFPTVSHSAAFSQTAENAYWNLWKSQGSRKSPAGNTIHLSANSRYTVLICYPTGFHFQWIKYH